MKEDVMMRRKIFLCLFLAILLSLYSEDIETTSEVNIILTGETGYGYIRYHWELRGIPEYEKLELKILNRIKNEETFDVTSKKHFVLDRGFPVDEQGNFRDITVWLVASIELKKKIGVKYYRTGTDYVASNMITGSPLHYPSPIAADFNDGVLICRLPLDNMELIDRFAGFRIDGKDFPKSFNPYGCYDIQIKTQPSVVSAAFKTYEKPLLNQSSLSIPVIKTNTNYSSKQKPLASDDEISYFAARQDSLDPDDILQLQIEEKQKPDCISVAWNKIENADIYLIYRTPGQDSLYRAFAAASLPAYQSMQYNRIRFCNNLHSSSGYSKEKLRSKNVYTYRITAKRGNDELGMSRFLSVYYYNGVNGSFIQEMKTESMSLSIQDEYAKLNSSHKGISKSLETKGFARHLADFSESDSLNITFHYIELQPYRYLESGNDGYISTEIAIRAFLPKEYGNDADLLALMTLINFDPTAKKSIISNTKILTDGVIRIPIPKSLIP